MPTKYVLTGEGPAGGRIPARSVTSVPDTGYLLEKSGECGIQMRMAVRLACLGAYGHNPAGHFQMDQISV
jgi:hypothetical protein